ncbi:MAG: hypothetical protein CMI28_04900 [Opitutae bacterium]|nr:hypothetical protein [Opitutae bacterium]
MNFSSGNFFLYFCGLNFFLSFLVTIFSLFTPFTSFLGIFSSVLLFLNSMFFIREILKRWKSDNFLDDSEKPNSSQIDPHIMSDLDTELARKKAQEKLERN